MKKQITKFINIDQETFMKIVEVKEFKGFVDLVDPTLFNWVGGLANAPKSIKKTIDNKLYVWASYQAAIDQNPLMNIICKRAIALRFKKLRDLGLLDFHYDKKDGNKTYFSVSSFAYDYLIQSGDLSKYVAPMEVDLSLWGCISNYNPYVIQITTPMCFKLQPLCNSNYNNCMLETVSYNCNKKIKTKKDEIEEGKSEKKNRLKDIELRRVVEQIKRASKKPSVVLDFTLNGKSIDQATAFEMAYEKYLTLGAEKVKAEYLAYQENQVKNKTKFIQPLHTWLGDYTEVETNSVKKKVYSTATKKAEVENYDDY